VLLLTLLLVLGVEDFIHFLDLLFKMVLVLLEFGFEGDAVVHMFFSEPLVLLVFVVLGHALLLDSSGFGLESVALLSHVGELLPHPIDLLAQLNIGGLGLVESDALFVAGTQVRLNLNVVLLVLQIGVEKGPEVSMHVRLRRLEGLDFLLAFVQLALTLLNLLFNVF